MSTKHKQRLVKNALVCTSDVDILPGPDFVNWIPIARKKLKVTDISENTFKYIYCDIFLKNSKGTRVCIIGSKTDRNKKYYQDIIYSQ